MANFTTVLAGLTVMATACAVESAPEPRVPSGFGLVGCVVEPDAPGPSFRMTINDRVSIGAGRCEPI